MCAMPRPSRPGRSRIARGGRSPSCPSWCYRRDPYAGGGVCVNPKFGDAGCRTALPDRLTERARSGSTARTAPPIEPAGGDHRMEQARVLAASRRMFIDGEWTEASNGAVYSVPNPATEEPVGTAPDATAADMQRAIAAARRAFDEGPWPRSSRHDRARVLTRIADAMERRKEEMRQLLIAEAGATWLTHEIQVETPIKMMRHYADLALAF